jgi:hypothetical protein
MLTAVIAENSCGGSMSAKCASNVCSSNVVGTCPRKSLTTGELLSEDEDEDEDDDEVREEDEDAATETEADGADDGTDDGTEAETDGTLVKEDIPVTMPLPTTDDGVDRLSPMITCSNESCVL